MTRSWHLLFACGVLACSVGSAAPSSPQSARRLQAYAKLPLVFEPEAGSGARFLARGHSYRIALTSTDATLVLGTDLVRLRWEGASADAKGTALEPLRGKSHYFIGNDPARWRTNVAQHARVLYQEVYPGIDVVYYGNQGNIEYDLVLRPGADLSKIHLGIDAPAPLHLDARGDLVVGLKGGEVRQLRPVVYQEINGQKRYITARYVLHGKSRVGFEVGSYEKDRPLILDPLLSYASFLGGTRRDDGKAIAADAMGNAYITGFAESSNFPTKDAFQKDFLGSGFISRDVFVTKVNPAGNEIIYSTYLGGSGAEEGAGIAVDSSGNVYVTGYTRSNNFPTTSGAIRGTGTQISFLTKLNPQGSGLVYSALIGNAETSAMALDSDGNAYLVGAATAGFSTTAGALQTSLRSGFVAKVNPSGSALVYSTFFGGASGTTLNSIAVDPSGNAYVTGSTSSADFPTVGTVISANGNVFVSKLNPAGSGLVYSTRIGGNQTSESATGIALDASGNAHLTGSVGNTTVSSDFPITAGAYRTTCATTSVNSAQACRDGFALKVNSAGSALLYSTYLNNGSNAGVSVVVDLFGNANVLSGGSVLRFNVAGTSLLSSIRLPISGIAYAMGMDPLGNLYTTGSSADGSTTGGTADAFQPTTGGNQDAYVVRIGAVGTVSAAGLTRTALAPLSAASAFGEGLATGLEVAQTNPLPTTLRGTTVKVIDSAGTERLAPLLFVSAGQINFLIPEGTALGAARFIFTSGDGRVQSDALVIDPLSPALFSALSSGAGVAAAIGVHVSGSGAQTSELVFRFDSAQNKIVAVPQDLGGNTEQYVLQLFGTGIRARSSLAAVRVKVGDDPCEVLFAGRQGEFEGLDQVNILLPRSLIGFGDADISLTVDGKKANVVTVNLAGIPKPRISLLSAWGSEIGQTIATFTATGRFLSGVSSIQFSPNDGLTVTNLRTTATTVTVQLAIAASASLGTRQITVISEGGISGTLPFTIRAAGVSAAPRISNLTFSGPTLEDLRTHVLTGTFDFTDADGDLIFGGTLQNSAKLSFNLPNTCTVQATDEFLHKPGQTSGTVEFRVVYQGTQFTFGSFFINVSLIDAAGRISNTISVPKSVWFC
jgi:uncharacterized protein (TIGR03437 family)